MPNRCGLLLLALLAGSCSHVNETHVCPSQCRIRIVLPEDPQLPPEVPLRIRVPAGAAVNLEVVGGRPAQAGTVLIFEQPALVDDRGIPLYTVALVTGSNHFRMRAWQSGACRTPAGCRFTVVNSGFGYRPAGLSQPGNLIMIPSP